MGLIVIELIVVLVFFVVVGGFFYFEFVYGPYPYRYRGCAGSLWRRTFPDAPKARVRAFLECFVGGMALSSRTRLKFRPNDKVLAVYRSLYGGRTPFGDNLECETFVEYVAAEFDLGVDAVLERWHEEVTLGELFGYVHAKSCEAS